MPVRAAYLASALALGVGILTPIAADAGKPQPQTKQKTAAPAPRGDLLQLGLYGSRGEAEWAWLSLHRKNSGLTDKLSALIDPGPNGAGQLLRAFVKDPRNDGEALCREAAKAGQTCFVARKAGAPAGEAPARPAPVVGFIPLPTVKPSVPGAAPVVSQAPVVAAVAPAVVAAPPPAPVSTVAPPVAAAVAPAAVPPSSPAPVAPAGAATEATVTVVSPPATTAAAPPAPLPTAPDALLAARTLDGFIRYSTDDAKVLAEIERRTRRRGRIGAVLPGGGLEVTPAILTQPEFNICALTFDDGPHRTVTRRILDILNEHKVVSTYFPVGNVAQRYPEIIRDFVASGHEIGNHSFTHNDMRPMKIETLRYEVSETNKVLRSLGGSSTLFRPPYGRYSQELLQVVKEENSQAVLWNVDTRDWKVRDPDKIVEHVTTAAGSGSVLLLHSTYPTTADALPRVISTLREKNCEFVTLSDWIARMQAAGELPVTNAALPGPAISGRMRN